MKIANIIALPEVRWIGATLMLWLLDAGFASVAVEQNVAGALLSPGGASLEALFIALLFLFARFAWFTVLVLGAARLTARWVGRGVDAALARRRVALPTPPDERTD